MSLTIKSVLPDPREHIEALLRAIPNANEAFRFFIAVTDGAAMRSPKAGAPAQAKLSRRRDNRPNQNMVYASMRFLAPRRLS